MDKNEIKKALYKTKPKAFLKEVRRDGIYYTTGQTITFLVPLDEIGDVIWEQQMDAQLLIRYLIE